MVFGVEFSAGVCRLRVARLHTEVWSKDDILAFFIEYGLSARSIRLVVAQRIFTDNHSTDCLSQTQLEPSRFCTGDKQTRTKRLCDGRGGVHIVDRRVWWIGW